MGILFWAALAAMVVLALLIGYTVGRYLDRHHYDGTVFIGELDEEGHAEIGLKWDIAYDELIKRKYMIFSVENNMHGELSQKQQSL